MTASHIFASLHASTSLLGQTTQWDLRRISYPMSGLVKLAVFTLLFMLARALGIMGGRNIRYWAARRQSRVFVRQSNTALRQHQLDEAIAIAERSPKSHIARLVVAGLRAFQSGTRSLSSEETLLVIRSSLARMTAEVRSDLKTGLSALASIASTAPFVGSFGTAIGIFDAFQGGSMSRASYISMVAGASAEALATTVLGLLVAIPAIWCHNYFDDLMEGFEIEMQNASLELLSYLTVQFTGRKRSSG